MKDVVKKVGISFHGEDFDIAYRECGSIDKPVLVCIHGNSGSSADFYMQFEKLGKDYRIIALDLPGHGDSGHPKTEEGKSKIYQHALTADVFALVLKTIGVEKYFMLGVSLGGHVAIPLMDRKNVEYAPEVSKRVSANMRGLIITGTPPLDFSMTGDKMMKEFGLGFNPNFMKDIPAEHRKELERFGIPHIGALMGAKENFNDGTERSETLAKLFIELQSIDSGRNAFMVDNAKKAQGDARFHYTGNMGNGSLGNQRQVMENTDIPTLVIAGKNDLGIRVEYMRNGYKMNDNTSYIEMDSGHGVYLTEQFSVSLGNFMRRVMEQTIAPKVNQSNYQDKGMAGTGLWVGGM